MLNHMILNQRKILNDMLIVDPSRINIEDIRHPFAGMFARLKRRGFGGNIDEAIKQLDVRDVTGGNITNIGLLTGFMEQVAGAPRTLQGAETSPGEKTATEINQVLSSALGRAGMMANLISMTLLYDIGFQIAHNTIQFMEEDTYVNMTGDSNLALFEE